MQQEELALRPVSAYGYADTTRIMDRMPLSTAPEARSSCFPCTNWVTRDGAPTKAQAPYEFITDDGGIMQMAGLRRERHRRLLDFVMSKGRPISMGSGVQGFFFDRRKAAEAVFGEGKRYTEIDKLAEEMQHITVRFVAPGSVGGGDFDPLCVMYRERYEFGTRKHAELGDALMNARFDARQFDGMAFLALSAMYLDRFLTEITLRYHTSLDVIFKMDEVAASLTRFALSNDYLPGKPLNHVLDLLGAAPSPTTRERIAAKLKSGRQADLLASLGIVVRIYNGKNCVFYKSSTAPTTTYKARGLTGAKAQLALEL